MNATITSLLVAALAGGLVVYIYFATRPAAYDDPTHIVIGGVSIEQVAGAGGTRPRVLFALGALAACVLFLVS